MHAKSRRGLLIPHLSFHKTLRLTLILALGLGLTAALVWVLGTTLPHAVRAATISPVTTTDDELNTNGNCSLREAIQAANTDTAVDACPAGSGGDTIILPAGTYTLSLAGEGEDNNTTGDLDVTDALTIVGAGPELTVIDGNQLDRVLDIRPTASTVVISGVTILNGYVIGSQTAGGLYVGADLVLTNTVVVSNAGFGVGTGGVYVDASVTLTWTGGLLTGNAGSWVGGMYVNGGKLIMEDVSISDNTSLNCYGGILVENGTASLTGNLLIGNRAQACGGGLTVFYSTLALSDTDVISNTASSQGGGLYIGGGSADISGGQIVSNTAAHGSGMCILGAVVTLTQVHVAANDAWGQGGGLYAGDSSTVTLNAVQLISNTAGSGGGIFVVRTKATVANSTIERNDTGLYVEPIHPGDEGDLFIHNTVISDNTTAGLVYTGTYPFTITLGGTPGRANIFRNNGPSGTMNVLVTAPGTNPPIRAWYNNWGADNLAGVESTLYHQFDDPTLAQVVYYSLTLSTTPSHPIANGIQPVTVTAALTRLLAPLPGAVISFTADLGSLSSPTSTTNAEGYAQVLLTSTVTGTATITATASVDPLASRPATATVSFGAWPWRIHLPLVVRAYPSYSP